MNIYKVLPPLDNERQIKLWHKALRAQWSATDLDWNKPRVPRKPSIDDELARVLTPVLMGEQSALYSVSGLIPVLGHRSEVEGQFYLTTWAVDEARHTELFARYYGRLQREPMSIRRFPAGYLFQSRIISKEPAEWPLRRAGQRVSGAPGDGAFPRPGSRPGALGHQRRHPQRRSQAPRLQPHLPRGSFRQPLRQRCRGGRGLQATAPRPTGPRARRHPADFRGPGLRTGAYRHRSRGAVRLGCRRGAAAVSSSRSKPGDASPRRPRPPAGWLTPRRSGAR